MSKFAMIVSFLILLLSCNEIPVSNPAGDTVATTATVTEIPQLDIGGPVEVVLTHGETEHIYADGISTYVLHNYSNNDTLMIRYVTDLRCEDCRLETQIWRGDKYVDLVRDTGYGMGDYTRIPISTLQRCSQDGSPDYQELALYLSVRQYHPVETGNKRFLFYLKLK